MCTYYKVPGFDYGIDVDGLVWNLSTGKISIPVNGDVTLESLWGPIVVSLAKLLIFTFLVGNKDLSLLWRIVPLFLDGDRSNVSLSNLIYRFDNSEGPLFDKWYPIPYFSQYLTDGEGNIIRTKDFLPLTPRVDKNGYLLYTLRKDMGMGKTKACGSGYHRIHAMAFIPYPPNFQILHVNHIDGVKENNTTDNLEWVTPRENIVHAVTHGLRKDNRVVLARDVMTGEVKTFHSMATCAAFMNIAHNTLAQRLLQPGQPIWPELFQFKYGDDPSEWRIPNSPITELGSLKRRLPVMALCISSGKVTQYTDAASAEKHTGQTAGSVRWKLDKALDELPLNGFLFRYEYDSRPWPTYTDFQLRYFDRYPKKPPYPVRCTDCSTSTVVDYLSVEEASECLGINPATICSGIKNQGNVMTKYRFEYLDILSLTPKARAQ